MDHPRRAHMPVVLFLSLCPFLGNSWHSGGRRNENSLLLVLFLSLFLLSPLLCLLFRPFLFLFLWVSAVLKVIANPQLPWIAFRSLGHSHSSQSADEPDPADM